MKRDTMTDSNIAGRMLLQAAFLGLAVMAAGDANAQTKLVWPIEGTPFEEWSIGNYVDLDTRPVARRDYRGGRITYDGHDALDIGLPHFRAMEEGYDIYAAAAGTVTFAKDGEYDRYSFSNPAPPGESGNYVVIDHGDGLTTLYGHMRKDSVAVTAGQTVAAGEVIGQIGSSGQSTGPHLHFTVRVHGQAVETFLDPDAWWDDPLPYSGEVATVMDSGIASDWPTTEEVEYGVEHQGVFQAQSTGQLVVMWNYLFGIAEGSSVSLKIHRPNGSVFSDFAWIQQGLGGGYWNHGVVLPPNPELGLWRSELTVNGSVLTSNPFRIVIPEPSSGLLLAVAVGTLRIARRRRRG
ncbi:Murein DD-endopeptidase MepM [Pseudobythopirellula maris]|uniref:Murein DD-endopeptidase MepM n=1 Tax=Pseudobythopirellula maris TaxID=2527991 RepID=A0A5C5ZT36_9BACT|nr:M23 family metallopeptidase [Pseudobythopirellula maris]TWT90386.1 Murein DD-endopeptidase MepM [Pseudobythopirellula maris]